MKKCIIQPYFFCQSKIAIITHLCIDKDNYPDGNEVLSGFWATVIAN